MCLLPEISIAPLLPNGLALVCYCWLLGLLNLPPLACFIVLLETQYRWLTLSRKYLEMSYVDSLLNGLALFGLCRWLLGLLYRTLGDTVSLAYSLVNIWRCTVVCCFQLFLVLTKFDCWLFFLFFLLVGLIDCSC